MSYLTQELPALTGPQSTPVEFMIQMEFIRGVLVKSDIVIIGGGAIGAATAYYLRTMNPSVSVTVIEKDPTYSIASTPRAAGGVRRLFTTPENIELSNYSIPFFEEFDQTMAVDGVPANIGFKKNGYLFIVPPDQRDNLKNNIEIQLGMGCNVIWLEPEEIQARFPSMYVGDLGAATLSPDDGWLDPHAVLIGFRKKAISLGAEFIADEVVNLETTNGLVTSAVLKSGQKVAGEKFVNAAGAWAKDLALMLGIKIPIEPLRRFEHYWECQDELEQLPYLKDPERLAFRPEGGGYTGGVPTLAEPRGYNFAVDSNYFDEVVWPALAHRFPKFERLRLLNTLPGLYDQNDFDGNMVIGPITNGPENFHLLAGYSGHGLMHAPGSGRAMAELLLKGCYETIDLTRFGYERIANNRPLRETGII